MVKIEIKGEKLIISILGLHRFWACKSKIELFINKIKSIKCVAPSLRPPFLRFHSTYVPWIIIAGTYYGKKRKEFWDTTLKNKAINIDLENDQYTRIVVDVEDPNKIIKEIQHA